MFGEIAIYPSINSTNDWALQCEKPPAVCLAEYQEQGRGRRGRTWLSPECRNIYMSLAWCFRQPLHMLGSVSLVAGIAVARTLHELGLPARLKWPNDVMVEDRKIAGILIESRSPGPGQALLAIGIGLNFDMSDADTRDIAQPWTDFISEYSGDPVFDRNRLVAELLDNLAGAFEQFSSEGFAPFRSAWDEMDLCRRRRVVLAVDDAQIEGEGLGVDDQGALKVSIDGEVRTFLSGDVTLRIRG